MLSAKLHGGQYIFGVLAAIRAPDHLTNAIFYGGPARKHVRRAHALDSARSHYPPRRARVNISAALPFGIKFGWPPPTLGGLPGNGMPRS